MSIHTIINIELLKDDKMIVQLDNSERIIFTGEEYEVFRKMNVGDRIQISCGLKSKVVWPVKSGRVTKIEPDYDGFTFVCIDDSEPIQVNFTDTIGLKIGDIVDISIRKSISKIVGKTREQNGQKTQEIEDVSR